MAANKSRAAPAQPESFADREASEISLASALTCKLDALIAETETALGAAGSVKGAQALVRVRQRVISEKQIADIAQHQGAGKS